MSDTVKIYNSVDEIASKFVSTIAQYKWDLIPDSQLQAAKQALTKSDYIMKIASSNPEAVHDAILKSAILGLDLTEGKRQGWLIPRKNQFNNTVIQLQVGYKGVEAIHQVMGVIDKLVIRVVRENDTFEWSGDDQEKPTHNADWLSNDGSRGEITGAFAVTYYPDKTKNVIVTPVSHIYSNHRDRADSYKSYKKKTDAGQWAFPPPWVSDEQSMIEKTMAFIAAKHWPANIRDNGMSSKILTTLHETDISDYTYGYTDSQKEAFFSLIQSNDALGMYLFTIRVGIEVHSKLFFLLKEQAKKGFKVKAGKDHGDFIQIGKNIFDNIKKAIIDEDAFLLKENICDSIEITYKLLSWYLNDDDYKSLTELNS